MLFDFVVGSVVQAMMMGLLAFRTKFIGKENRKLKRETKGKNACGLVLFEKDLFKERKVTLFTVFSFSFSPSCRFSFHFR